MVRVILSKTNTSRFAKTVELESPPSIHVGNCKALFIINGKIFMKTDCYVDYLDGVPMIDFRVKDCYDLVSKSELKLLLYLGTIDDNTFKTAKSLITYDARKISVDNL